MADRVSEVLLSIGSEFENIELIQAVLDESLVRLDFDEDSRYWIGIAVREAVANAIKHGNRQDPEKQVEVELYVEAGHVVIHVRDQGEGFDPDRVANPLDPANLLKPDGRGIFYMNRFMDAIEYNFGPEGGTVVTLRKRLCASSVDSGRGEEEQG
jgi:serine/threonine-protein kinase RsbW